ncbi:MAG: DUF1858 domain-containing protein [Candidatus Aquicultorales bacterium]
MYHITKETTVGMALELNPHASEVLMNRGMRCLACSIAEGETIGEAAAAHNVDVEELLKELNEEHKTDG